MSAADRTKEIARFNAGSVRTQFNRAFDNYNKADEQNRRLADVQLDQNRRKTEDDRFLANRNLQNASIGLFGAMGPTAFNSSTLGNYLRMAENRNDSDNVTYWGQQQQNADAINNAYEESVNQNVLARNESLANAEKALLDIEADLSANLNNIDKDEYVSPGTGDVWFGSDVMYNENVRPANLARMSGYIMPQESVQTARRTSPRNKVAGNDYFSRLINRFNGR